MQSSFDRAVKLGELLLDAKAEVPHGQWIGWLEANTPVSPRRSQALMRLAKNADQLRANTSAPSLLTVEAGLAELAEPIRAREASEKTSPTSTCEPPIGPDHQSAMDAVVDMMAVEHLGRAEPIEGLRDFEPEPGWKFVGVAGRQRVTLTPSDHPGFVHYTTIDSIPTRPRSRLIPCSEARTRLPSKRCQLS
jgi:hypothetical protein